MKNKEISKENKNESLQSCYSVSSNNDPGKGRGGETNLRGKSTAQRKQWKESTKTDELRDSGKIARKGHCESYKDTEAAMIWPHKMMDEKRISGEESDRVETRLQKNRRKIEKLIGGSIKGHKKVKNLQLKGEDPGQEVMEVNHKKGKDEQGIRI